MMKQIHTHQESLLFVLGVITFASILLGGAAFTRPLTQDAVENIPYEHRGKFAYTGIVPVSVYDSPAAQTGDPIFRKLTNQVNLSFEYQLSSDKVQNATGTYRLLIEISDPQNGWKRVLELVPQTPFNNGAFTVNGTMDLKKVQDLIDQMTKETEISRQQYYVAVIPEVNVHGAINDQPLDDRFAPRLEFHLTTLEMFLAPRSPSDSGNPFRPSQVGLYRQSATRLNTIPMFSFGLNVALGRTLAVIGFISALFLMILLGALQMLAGSGSEHKLIELKYASLLVQISGDPLSGQTVIEVGNIDHLINLAEREGRVILYQVENGVHQYFVQDNTRTYRYQLPSVNKTPAPQETMAAKSDEGK